MFKIYDVREGAVQEARVKPGGDLPGAPLHAGIAVLTGRPRRLSVKRIVGGCAGIRVANDRTGRGGRE